MGTPLSEHLQSNIESRKGVTSWEERGAIMAVNKPNPVTRLRDEANGIALQADNFELEFELLSPQEQADEMHELYKVVDSLRDKISNKYTELSEKARSMSQED